MQQLLQSRWLSIPNAAARCTGLARGCAACMACAVLLAEATPAHADSGAKPLEDKVVVVRPRLWWLPIYAHTMQEEAFLRWMDVRYHGPAWRHTMQEVQVNSMWLWWCKTIWNPASRFGNSAP